MSTWRYIESPPADIFSQMALDRKLFEDFVQDPGLRPLVRIYRVTEPSITVGRSWTSSRKAKGARPLFDRRPPRNDETICIRPTGGGLVHHGKDLIYSVIARSNSFPTFHQVRTSYLSFHEAVLEALEALGVEARLFRCDEARPLTLPSPPQGERVTGEGQMTDCFTHPVATDVLYQEKKIAGGGQWRRREGFLHQGSIQIPRGLSYDDLRKSLRSAFERKFSIVWQDQPVGAGAR